MILRSHVVIGVAQLAIALLAVVAATSSGTGGDRAHSHPATTQATVCWILGQSWPNLISHVLAHGIAHIGIIVFATFGAEHDVAAFGVIRRLMLLVGAPLQLLNVALSPFVVELHSQDRIRELQSLLRVTATLAAIPALAVLAVIMVLPSTILGLFGEQYATAAVPLMVLGASNLIFVLCGSNTLTLRMTGWQIVSMSNGLITGSIYLMALPTIIERYGILGAAGAAATLLVVRNLSSTLLVRKFVGVWPVPILWPAKFMREFGVLRRQHSVAV